MPAERQTKAAQSQRHAKAATKEPGNSTEEAAFEQAQEETKGEKLVVRLDETHAGLDCPPEEH